ncbi:MAG: hypothetical protein AB1938_03650 [Myxococcota bacterium]
MRCLFRLSVGLLAGCGGGAGSVTFTTWGEEYIEDRIPAQAGAKAGFVDGWEVSYARFLVVLGEVTLAKKTGEAGPKQTAPLVVDLKKPGPVELFAFQDVPATKWDKVSFAVAPATSSATRIGAIAAADVERMKTGGLSLFVEGTGTKGTVTKRFAWGFTTNTLYDECQNDDFGEGVAVPTGGNEVVQLTIHGDHFWYDDLESPDARLRFEAIAGADGNLDGEVTLDELAAVQLTSLPLGQYGTGSAGSVKTLEDFVTSLSRTVGHFRGEGECVSKAR